MTLDENTNKLAANEAELQTLEANLDLLDTVIETDLKEALNDLDADLNNLNGELTSLDGRLSIVGNELDKKLDNLPNVISETHISENSISTPKLQANSITANEITAGSISAEKIASKAITSEKIEAGAITAGKIAAGSITANEIGVKAITAEELSAGSITAEKIASKAITCEKIEASSITAEKIASKAITANEINAGSITADEIASKTITAEEIAAGAITATKIEVGAITAEKIASKAITAEEIAAKAITADEIAVGAITADKIAVGAITADKIAVDAITANEIGVGAITAEKIAVGAITANEIGAGAITAEEIASKAITSDHIEAGTITALEIDTDAITTHHLSAESVTAKVLASDTIETKHIKTDAILSKHIRSNQIIANLIGADQILSKHIMTNQITADHIGAQEIKTHHMKFGTINGSVIEAGTITANEIAAGTITSTNILGGSIIGDDISGDTITGGHIRADAIETKHIKAESIKSEHVASNFITALKLVVSGSADYLGLVNQSKASAAALTNLNSDSIITPKERRELRDSFAVVVAQYGAKPTSDPVFAGLGILKAAANLNVNTTALETAFGNLNDFLTVTTFDNKNPSDVAQTKAVLLTSSTNSTTKITTISIATTNAENTFSGVAYATLKEYFDAYWRAVENISAEIETALIDSGNATKISGGKIQAGANVFLGHNLIGLGDGVFVKDENYKVANKERGFFLSGKGLSYVFREDAASSFLQAPAIAQITSKNVTFDYDGTLSPANLKLGKQITLSAPFSSEDLNVKTYFSYFNPKNLNDGAAICGYSLVYNSNDLVTGVNVHAYQDLTLPQKADLGTFTKEESGLQNDVRTATLTKTYTSTNMLDFSIEVLKLEADVWSTWDNKWAYSKIFDLTHLANRLAFTFPNGNAENRVVIEFTINATGSYGADYGRIRLIELECSYYEKVGSDFVKKGYKKVDTKNYYTTSWQEYFYNFQIEEIYATKKTSGNIKSLECGVNCDVYLNLSR